MAFLRILPPFFWFAAFLLLLLVSLSVPIIHPIYLLTATATVTGSVLGVQAGNAQETVNFGVWGWCAGEATVTIVGQTSTLEPAQCSAPHLGYTLDPNVSALLQLTNEQQNSSLILHSVTAALVLHPIACGLSFLALALSFYVIFARRVGWFGLLAVLPAAWLAGIVATVIFVVDVVFVAIARSKIYSATNGAVTIGFGNGVWMVLGAMVASWLGLVGTCGGTCCGERGWARGRGKYAREEEAKF